MKIQDIITENQQGVAEGIMKSLATRLVKGAANRQTPQEIANTHVRALNQRAPGTRMQGHPNFADFKREVHSYISAAQNGEQAFARTTDDHVKSLFKKYFSEGVSEGVLTDIRYAWVRILTGLADKVISLTNSGELNAKQRDAIAHGTKELEQKLLAKISGHPREQQLRPYVDYIVKQVGQQTNFSDFSKTLYQMAKQFKPELGKFSEGIREGQAQPLTVAQLATISDEALDRAYGYGRSQPGNTFGWQANLKSAAYAKKMIDSGITDIEAISDAIHKGWNVTAQAFVQNPDQFADTEKLRAAGKLQAKLDQRAKLMRQDYAQLADEEKEKDRVVARALLQAITGNQLDEINRRDFLRGAGAAAVAGATAGLPNIAQAQSSLQDIDRQIEELEQKLRSLYRTRADMKDPPPPRDAKWGPGSGQLTYKDKIYTRKEGQPPQGSKGPIITMFRPGVRGFSTIRIMLVPDGHFYDLGPTQ